MRKFTKNSDIGYKITDSGEGWGYYITIGNGKEYRHYEYSGAFQTLEEVEKYLKKHSYDKIVEDFKNWCVYLECVEEN